MKIFFLILFLSFLTFVGCEKKPTTARLVLIDTLKADVRFGESDIVFFDETTNTEYLVKKNTWGSFDTTKRNLAFYTLNEGNIELAKTIYLNFPRNISNFLIHSFDSIYTIPYQTKHLFLFDGDGNEVNRWSLDLFDSDSVMYLPLDRTPIMNNGILYLHLSAIKYDNYYKQKFIGMLQIENGEIIKSNKIINFPKYYQQERSYMFYSPYSPSFLIHKENELVISHVVSHNLYIYKNDSTFRTVDAKSKFLDTFRFVEENNVAAMKQQVEDGHYLRIVYDKYRNLYYRVVFHNQPFENPDGTVNYHNTHPWSIIVMDGNFRKIDEIFFPANEFLSRNLLVTSQGLILTKVIKGEGLFAKNTYKQILYELVLE